MSAVKINTIIKEIEVKINSILSVYPRKRIIFNGKTNDLQSISIVTPESSLNASGKGLVDFTKIQKNILDNQDIAMIIFRLTNGEVFYVDYKNLKSHLTSENMTFNDRAFEHWKLHLYPNERIVKIKDKDHQVPMQNYLTIPEQNSSIIYPDDIEDKNLFEGTTKQIMVNAYERSSKARKECIEHYGTICSICDFNFEEIYGKIGKNFIHVHHLTDISTIAENYIVNPIIDLRPVCPNCHAMLHKQRPAFSIEKIKSLIKK